MLFAGIQEYHKFKLQPPPGFKQDLAVVEWRIKCDKYGAQAAEALMPRLFVRRAILGVVYCEPVSLLVHNMALFGCPEGRGHQDIKMMAPLCR